MVTSLSNRTVLVTGANNGIGAAIVLAFARYGARIGLHFLEHLPGAVPGVQIGHTLDGRAGAKTVSAKAAPSGRPSRSYRPILLTRT